jgi:hypothetical protein
MWPKLALGTLGLVGIVMIVAIPIACRELLPDEAWLGALGIIPLLGAVCALLLVRKTRLPAAATVVALTSLAFTTSLFGVALSRVDRHQQNHTLLAAIQRTGGNPQVGSFRVLEPTWVFYGRRPITELATELPATGTLSAPKTATQSPPNQRRSAATVNHLGQPPTLQMRKTRPDVADFFGDGQDRLIITTDQHWEKLQNVLPPGATVLAECPLFLRPRRLLLVGLASAPNTASAAETPASVRR